jgi:hypothetical protein
MTALPPRLPNTAPCAHANVDLRALTCSNGTIQYVKQCLICGEKIGNPIKKADVIAARGPLEFILPFDETARSRGRHALTQARKTVFEEDRAARNAAFNTWYAQYLETDAWQAIRAKVLRRANGVCEGCMDARPTEIHHLTYQHVGQELLFELVALCRPCHEAAHRERDV